MDDLMEEIERLKKENESLKNRCFVMTNGQICLLCPMQCAKRTANFRGNRGTTNE